MDNLARGGARVKRLILQGNKLGVDSAKHIAATIPSNRYLRSLSLRFNNIGDEGTGVNCCCNEVLVGYQRQTR